MRIVLIDNYDSFTHNLAQLFLALGAGVRVVRNDAVSAGDLRMDPPDLLCISPGPGAPSDAGVSLEAVRACAGAVPIFGVCLGMQVINEIFGGRTVRAAQPVHGRRDAVRHDGAPLFAGIPSPFEAARYHSLAVETFGELLRPTAWSADGTIMAIEHRALPVWGVQFHPESFMTSGGPQIARNVLRMAGDAR
jgi:anthranilate synthase/aminodeoxychorismate synthase-like glutamine amidotransferase